MRKTDVFILFLGLFLFYVATPSSAFKASEHQAQEAAASESVTEMGRHTYLLSMEVPNAEEVPIADILWLKRAAQVALEKDIPYFNISEMEIFQHYSPDEDRMVTVIEGVVSLELDSIKAEYDAFMIEDMVLPHHSEY